MTDDLYAMPVFVAVAVATSFRQAFYLFCPQRRHASRALRALVDYLRGVRHSGRAKRSPCSIDARTPPTCVICTGTAVA